MDGWRTAIRCYVSLVGNPKIAEWYASLSVQGKSDADEFLKNMRRTGDWQMPNYRGGMRGIEGVKDKDVKGLGELRWTSEKVEHRLLGFFHGGSWCALIGCTHKGKVYDPANALVTAVKRKKQVENGEVTTVAYEL